MKTKLVSFIILLFLNSSPIKAQTWEFVGLDSMVIKQLYVSGDTIWAGTAHRTGNLDKSGLYKSTDGGNSWTRLDDTIGIGNVSLLSIDEENTNTIYLLKSANAYGNSGIFYRTTDGGKNWDYAQNITQNVVQWFGISPFNKNEMYIIDATYAPGGILNSLFKSTDKGNTWKDISAFPISSHGSRLTFAFALTDDSLNLYVTADTQFDKYLYKSTNKGNSWNYISNPPVSPIETKTDLFLPERIYLFAYYKASDDEGLTWYDAYSGLCNNIDYLSFYQDEKTTRLLYNLRTDGLYSSKNDTIFWSLEVGSENLPIYFSPTGFYSDWNMKNIFIESVKRELFLGTAEGIYKTSIITNVNADDQRDLDFSLKQNYPNPFNATTNIEFRISNFGFVFLKVYDVLGKEIATLINEEKSPGSYEVDYDATGLPSGIYFYRLQASNFIKIKKMVLIK